MQITNLKKFLSSKSYKRILIISGNKSYKKIKADQRIIQFLKNKNLTFFFKKQSYPEKKELLKIISIIKKTDPSLIIAIGGGCVMDYAKSANALACLKKFKLSNTLSRCYTKLLCIPTTAGSGAEVTPSSVLYINKIKTNLSGKGIKPNYYCLEPSFIKYNSQYNIASSGFDALSQCIESILSKKSNAQSIKYAKKSIELILGNLTKFYKKKDFNSAYKLSIAANLSGKAISISNTGAPHALSYIFSSHFNLSHGHSVSLNTLKIIKFNYLKSSTNKLVRKRIKIIFKCFKCQNFAQFEKKFNSILKTIKLEQNYNKLRINTDKLKRLDKYISVKRLKNNLIKIEKKDLKKILINNYA